MKKRHKCLGGRVNELKFERTEEKVHETNNATSVENTGASTKLQQYTQFLSQFTVGLFIYIRPYHLNEKLIIPVNSRSLLWAPKMKCLITGKIAFTSSRSLSYGAKQNFSLAPCMRNFHGCPKPQAEEHKKTM